MKKLALVTLMVAGCFGSKMVCWADSFSDNFKSNLNTESLNALAKDVGGLVGAGADHTGKNLGFVPIGFDVGVNAVAVGVSNTDAILRDNGSTVSAVWGQGELGLPLRLGLIVRGGKVDTATMIGGGLRWTVLSMDAPFLPSLSIEGLYGRTTQQMFDMDTYTGNAVLSFNVPFVHPYIAGGYDYSNLNPTSAALEGSPDQSVTGSGDSLRVEAGVNLSIIPFTYITLGIGQSNGEKMYHGGLGVNF